MSLYRRKDSPYWWYTFTLDGRRFQGSTGERAGRDARKVEARKRLEASGARGARQTMTLEIATARYWRDHASRLRSAPTIDYQITNLLDCLGDDMRLDRLADDDVSIMMATMRGRMADSSANRHLTLLRAILRMARDAWGVEVAMPNFKTHWLTEPAPRDRWLRPEEADRVIAEAADHLKPPIAFSLLTGVRQENAIALDWSQVDMKALTITFRIKSKRPGRKPHVLPITEPVLVLLANLGPKEVGPVFTYKDQRIRTWKTGWRAALRRAGIKDFRWHDLRHTFGAWLAQAGVPFAKIRDLMGHASITTTERYAHCRPDYHEGIAAVFDDAGCGKAALSGMRGKAEIVDVS